ncbi:retrovirus-related pol polyprotein from transposon TNT 1-94 [Tanacetum coccineum]
MKLTEENEEQGIRYEGNTKPILALGFECCPIKVIATIDSNLRDLGLPAWHIHVGGGVYESEGFGWTWGGQRGLTLTGKRKMENINKVRVKELRSDNGIEFRNHKLEEFYDEEGISQNLSSPCTPEQNSIAERRNRTLIEATRTIPLRKIDAKVDNGFFLGYSPVAKAFRVFNIRRQEMEETYHVTFREDDKAISKSSTHGDEINFNENISFPYDEFLVPRNTVSQCSGNDNYLFNV